MGRLNSALSALANRGVFDMSENQPAVEVVPIETTEAAPTIPTVIDSPEEARNVPADELSQVVEFAAEQPSESIPTKIESEVADQPDEPHAFEMPAAQTSRVGAPPPSERISVDTPTIQLPLRSPPEAETPTQESADSQSPSPGVFVPPGDDEPEDPAAEADAALREVEQFGARFSSNTTDMNELRAQLGIVSKAEISARPKGQAEADSSEAELPESGPVESSQAETEQPESVQSVESPSDELSQESPSDSYRESPEADDQTEQIDSDSEATESAADAQGTVEFPGEGNELQSQSADDESQQVIKLVEQVLGISPGIRTDQSDNNVIDAVTAASSQDPNDSSAQPADEPADESSMAYLDTNAEEANQAAAESDEDPTQEMPTETFPMESESREDSSSEGELAPEGDAYSPVMQNWATIPPAANPVGDSSVIDSDSVATDPPHEPLESEAQFANEEEITAQQQEATLPTFDASAENSEAVAATEVTAQMEDSPVEIEVEVEASLQPEEAVAEATELPERKDPTEFEVALAERLLKSDFGLQIQELSNNVISEFNVEQPAAMVMVSIDGDPQRSDVVAGLGMVVCAQRTSPTLIVDADVDQRAISQGFEQSSSGLLESLNERTPWPASIDATSCERLRVLGSGSDRQAIHDSASLVARAKTAVDQWKQEFGLVLIDGGPISSPLAIALAAASDATFVCVELGQSERDNLVEATERLVAAGATVKGCITTGTAAPS